jgi:peroxiredoxin
MKDLHFTQEALMAVTPSTMLDLGTLAPQFRLPDTDGNEVALSDLAGARPFLVMFLCNHCPFVKHVRQELARLGKEYQERGVGVVAISSNDVETYPDDSPPRMKEEKAQVGYTFPYLFDETQEVAKAYRAACTPDFYVFDAARKLVYRGQLDDSRPSNEVPVTGKDLRAALDAVVANRPVEESQKASVGCNIKWKKGNEPDYFG